MFIFLFSVLHCLCKFNYWFTLLAMHVLFKDRLCPRQSVHWMRLKRKQSLNYLFKRNLSTLWYALLYTLLVSSNMCICLSQINFCQILWMYLFPFSHSLLEYINQTIYHLNRKDFFPGVITLENTEIHQIWNMSKLISFAINYRLFQIVIELNNFLVVAKSLPSVLDLAHTVHILSPLDGFHRAMNEITHYSHIEWH